MTTVGACVWLVMAIVGWVRARMEVVDGRHAGQGRGVGRMPGDAVALPECEVQTPPSWCAALGTVEPELVGLPGKALTRDATRRLRFVFHAVHGAPLTRCCVRWGVITVCVFLFL